MRVAFLGTDRFGLPALKALIESDHELVGVVTGPDKPKGRGQKLEPTPIRKHAEQAGIKVLTPTNLKDPEFHKSYRAWNLDAAVVVAFRILPSEVFDSPKHGTLNIHPSLLPRYRGPAPLNWTLINGDTQTGVSIIRISEKVDAGGVVKQISFDIHPDETAGELAERIAPVSANLMLEALGDLEKGTLTVIEQDESLVTKAPKLTKEDGAFDWSQSATALNNRARGVQPWPGAYTHWNGKQIKLHRQKVAQDDIHGAPGEILIADEKDNRIVVACGNGTIEITELQQEGKKRMSASDFIRGTRIKAGERWKTVHGKA